MKQPHSRVAAVQMASSPNVSANLLEAERLIDAAVDTGARLVVLPENFAFMGRKEREMCTLAESEEGGPLQDFLAQAARRYGTWLVGGTIPLQAREAGKIRAATLVFDDQGRRVARYDKMHLFDVELVESGERYVESETIEPGDQVVVLESPFGRLGVAVCYDLRFPELFRNMLDRGMELLVIPSAFTAITGKAHWEILVRARAVENLCYVIAAAQGGYHISGRETHGHSMIVDPWGRILAEMSRGTGYVSQPLDPDYRESVRRSFPAIDHRRLRCR